MRKRWWVLLLLLVSWIGAGAIGGASSTPAPEMPEGLVEAAGRQAIAAEATAQTLYDILDVLVRMESTQVVTPCSDMVKYLEEIAGHQEVQARAALGPTYLEEYPEGGGE